MRLVAQRGMRQIAWNIYKMYMTQCHSMKTRKLANKKMEGMGRPGR